jgi:hypothetical protein
MTEVKGLKRPNVNKAMRRLEEPNIILRNPKVGRSCAWRLNPDAGWKGKLKELRPALQAVE